MARRGKRGEGSVYFSKTDRRWVARFPLGVVNGKRVAKRVKAPNERAARVELERLRRAYGVGGSPATSVLDAYLAGWLIGHRDVRASTHRSYTDHVRLHISPLLGGIPVARLRPSDIDRLIADRLAAGLSPSTVRRIITTLHVALQAGVRRGEIADNVAGMVRLPRVQRQSVRAMSADDGHKLLDAVAGHWLEQLVRLLLGSGLRLGEALALDQEDLFPAEGFVRLRASKTTIRAVPVSEDAADALRMALAVAPRRGAREPVFFGPRTGDRLKGSTASHALPRVLERAGLERLTPHGLRHGAATLMVASGVHMRVVAEQLGHRNPALTARIYAHVLPESQREAVRSLPRRSEVR